MPDKSRRPSPPPSPIPTGKGSRSAAGPVLAHYIDYSSRVPELTLPQHVCRHKLEEISYGSLLFKEKDTVRGFLRLVREYGVFRIGDHGIPATELRSALGISDRIFGSTVACLYGYGDHEKLVWRADDLELMEKASALIGDHNFRNLWMIMRNVGSKLVEIAEELAKVMDEHDAEESGTRRVRLGEPTLSIYRYHRANIIDRISSSVIDKTSRESGPYALSLHVMLESGELCVQTGCGELVFATGAGAIVVTLGKQIEQLNHGRFKSGNGELMFRPYLHSNKPSFSIEQKWSFSNTRDVNKTISLVDQFMILLILSVFYRSFIYLCP